MHSCTKWILSIIVTFLTVGCATKEAYRAPVTDLNRAPPKFEGQHVISQGETLYSIAWRYNRDFHELARVNGLTPPYTLRPGQRLSLKRTGTPFQRIPPPVYARSEPIPIKQSVIAQSAPKKTVAAPSSAPVYRGPVHWEWPSSGRIIEHFSAQNGQKGIDIAGQTGQAVMAAAPGVVVYSGSGLRGYGQLIIIKHNEDFLSAYAHNSRLLVREGDSVKAQTKIAEMGQTDTQSVRLHFEIRKSGQPVDPLKYLPKRG